MENKEKGITLIILIVTIIALAIIAGVTVSMTVSSDNATIKEANNLQNQAQKESIIEKIEADLYTERTTTGEKPDFEKLKTIASRYGTIENGDSVENAKLITSNGNYEIYLKEFQGFDNSNIN